MARAENINPGILAWARQTAGLSLEDAAVRIGLSGSTTLSAAEKLVALEHGEQFPTRAQLAKIASVYRRPLVTFYLREPPRTAARGEDFRTLPADVPLQESAKLDALLRGIRARQEMVRSLLDDEDTRRLDFVASASVHTGVQPVVDSIATRLEFPLDARRTGTPVDLFKTLRARAEAIGVFVLLVGDLGSHHHTISERVFRGFAIADPVAPFIIINDQDARAALSFTLIHELCHIWLGQTGISGMVEDTQATTTQQRIEQFCNDVAGLFLLPGHAFAGSPDFDRDDEQGAVRSIRAMADAWRVSEPMVAYRMSRQGWISGRVYRKLSALYASRWTTLRAKAREDSKGSESGLNYYTVKQFKVGNALMGLVQRSVRDNVLSHTKAAKVLGVGPGVVESMLKRFESAQGALVPGLRRE